VLIEVCSVLLTSLPREKSSPRVYIHPVNIVILLMGQLFLFCFDLRHRFSDDRCFPCRASVYLYVFLLHKYFQKQHKNKGKNERKKSDGGVKRGRGREITLPKGHTFTRREFGTIISMVQFLLVIRFRRIMDLPDLDLYP
jgi:hypothetical protein